MIKLRSSCIVALLLDEKTKIQIFEETTKMFISRMEEFEQMSSAQKDEALKAMVHYYEIIEENALFEI